jgi:hypothetical protein
MIVPFPQFQISRSPEIVAEVVLPLAWNWSVEGEVRV